MLSNDCRLFGVQVLRACERALLWNEAVYLYKEDGQYDSAVKTMIEHCICFQHELFLDCVKKVGLWSLPFLLHFT